MTMSPCMDELIFMEERRREGRRGRSKSQSIPERRIVRKDFLERIIRIEST